jgi:hypothetical protein
MRLDVGPVFFVSSEFFQKNTKRQEGGVKKKK